MKLKILIILLLPLITGVVSCKKFLQEQSPSEVVPKTTRALNELLAGEAYKFWGTTSWLLDDNIWIRDLKNFIHPSMGAFTWQPSTSPMGNDLGNSFTWFDWYNVIQACNTVIDQLEKVSGTQEEKDFVFGQALLLRAYNYFNLVNFYALPYTDSLTDPNINPGVPLLLKGGVSLERVPRNTVAEVYQQIEKDILKGTELLLGANKTDDIMRINHLAGYLLASRVYLHMGKWQQCIDAANKMLSNKSTLMTLSSWGPADPLNKPIVANRNIESIWEFSAVSKFSFIIDYDDLFISPDLMSCFEPGDLRATIYTNGIRCRKTGFYDGPVTDVPGMAFRVSEAYLNRAEAYAHQFKEGQTNGLAASLSDLNLLRKNRFTIADYRDLQTSDADQLMDWCRLEKRREFFHEESHRWFDLRRAGMPSIVHEYDKTGGHPERFKLQKRDPGYLLEIPQSAILLNNKLVQNPLPAERLPE